MKDINEVLISTDTNEETVQLSKGRWWVLATFSLFAFTQGMLWAIPGPISGAMTNLYGLDDTTIQLLINYGPIFYIPLSIPLAYWMDKPGGVRQATIWGILTVALGQLCRNLAYDNSTLSIALVHISYILNAIAGPVAMSAVGKISEDWFPVEFRSTSTAIMAEANLFGGAAAQLIGPQMVSDLSSMKEFLNFMYLCSAFMVLNVIMVLIYFPSHPPHPPSISATTTKAAEQEMSMKSFGTALKQLFINRSFIILICAYGLSTGMYGSWATVLSLNLNNCNAIYVGWLSFASTIAGNIGGLVLGRIADKFRNMKRLLVIFMALSGISFVLFALLASGIIKGQTICYEDGSAALGLWILLVLGVLGGLFLNSTIPLYYELSLEVTYPIPEATVCTMLTNMNNVGCLIFLGIPVTQYGSAWMNWLFSMTICVFTIGLIFLFDERTLRYKVDTNQQDDDNNSANNDNSINNENNDKEKLLLRS